MDNNKENEYLSAITDLSKNDGDSSLKLLLKIISKILSDPYNEKYRNINYDKIHKKFGKFNCSSIAIPLLIHFGFKTILNDKDEQRLIIDFKNHYNLHELECKLKPLQSKYCDINNIVIINQLTEDTVFGFIRESQSLFLTKSTYFNIPKLVSVLCLSYYHKQRDDQNKEYFTSYTDRIQLDDTETIFTKTGLEHDTVYGNIIINSEYPIIYRWEIEILKWEWDHSKGISIGIDSSNKQYFASNSFLKICCDKLEYMFYAYNCIGNKWSKQEINDFLFQDKERYGTGDTICMELNIATKTLKFFKNNKNIGVVFENIDLEDNQYHLAISMDEDNTIVKIKSFEQIYPCYLYNK